MITFLSTLFICTLTGLCGPDQKGPESFPTAIASDCRGGSARLFDECGDQLAILADGQARAAATGKTLLVSYGAEWCIWCHVLHKYLAGEVRVFEYDFEMDDGTRLQGALFERANPKRDAAALEAYAAENFVLVHIENRFSPNGVKVLEALGADVHFTGALPFTFSVVGGAFNRKLPDSIDMPEIEIRRDTDDWFRGYDRRILLDQLKVLRKAAAG